MMPFFSSGCKNLPREIAEPMKEIFASESGSIPTSVTPLECLALLTTAFTLTRELHNTPSGIAFLIAASTTVGSAMR